MFNRKRPLYQIGEILFDLTTKKYIKIVGYDYERTQWPQAYNIKISENGGYQEYQIGLNSAHNRFVRPDSLAYKVLYNKENN